jgi:hypothetical protein
MVGEDCSVSSSPSEVTLKEGGTESIVKSENTIVDRLTIQLLLFLSSATDMYKIRTNPNPSKPIQTLPLLKVIVSILSSVPIPTHAIFFVS